MRIEHITQYGIVIHDIIGIEQKMDVQSVRNEVIVHEQQLMKQNMIVERENIMT